jgi:hypothetical protein
VSENCFLRRSDLRAPSRYVPWRVTLRYRYLPYQSASASPNRPSVGSPTAPTVARDNHGDLAETASYLELSLGFVQAAAAYYATYSQEIDERIERNRREAHDAHGAFLAARAALGG